jgi:hypothetical protein
MYKDTIRKFHTVLTKGAVLFCPRSHVVLRLDEQMGWRVGLTDHAMEKHVLGDIDSVSLCSTSIKVHWSGLKMSEGDELYHTIWEEAAGEHTIELPAQGDVGVVLGSESTKTDEICRLRASPFHFPWKGLVEEKEYLSLVSK